MLSSIVHADSNSPIFEFELNYDGDLRGNGNFSFSGKISHTSNVVDKMPLQTSVVWENGYFKPEFKALPSLHSHSITADTANLVVFSQINTMLDRNPALLARLKKQCDVLEKENKKLQKNTLSKLKAARQQIQALENQFLSLGMEYEK